MVNQIDHIVGHLFHQKNLDEVSEAQLEEFIASYPYFAAGHLLLAKKVQRSLSQNSNEKFATTGLYYHNALWLQWLLDQDLSADRKKLNAEELASGNNHEDLSALRSVKEDTGEVDHGVISKHQEETETHGTNSAIPGEHTIPVEEFIQAQEIIPGYSASEHEEKTISSDEPPSMNDNPDIAVADLDSEKQKEFESVEQSNGAGDEQTLHGERSIHSEAVMSDQQAEPSNDLDAGFKSASEESITPDGYKDDQVLPVSTNEAGTNEQEKSNEAESKASAASIQRTLTTAALIPTRAEMENNEFTFEPYHTIDYFASQGIRLQQSDLSKDKFGKQLKSFTEWLRSMKRLPQAAVESNMDEATQQSIQNIAEHSFEEKEIVTETMAEVWIKQGNKEKAIDTLHKLSLLNPSKSHYFAAKIEQLKA